MPPFAYDDISKQSMRVSNACVCVCVICVDWAGAFSGSFLEWESKVCVCVCVSRDSNVCECGCASV
jgi:hypothetical protein